MQNLVKVDKKRSWEKEVGEAFGFAVKATDDRDCRRYMHAVYLQLDGTLVATDGRRLHMVELTGEQIDSAVRMEITPGYWKVNKNNAKEMILERAAMNDVDYPKWKRAFPSDSHKYQKIADVGGYSTKGIDPSRPDSDVCDVVLKSGRRWNIQYLRDILSSGHFDVYDAPTGENSMKPLEFRNETKKALLMPIKG